MVRPVPRIIGPEIMKTKQLQHLFLMNLVTFTAGNGLLPLLPVYARQLGASESLAGLYLASTFAALTVGMMLTGWAAGRVALRRLYLTAVLLAALFFWLAGQATTAGTMTLFTAVVWFCGGVQVTTIHLTIGHAADPASRGRSFSWMYLALPLGALIGGLSLGPLADGLGYRMMFSLVGLTHLSLVPLAFLALAAKPLSPASPAQPEPATANLSPAFRLLLTTAFLFNIAVFVGRLGTSLQMETFGFSATAVSSTAAIGGLVSLPFIFWFGALSDRLGRRRFLAINYLTTIVGVLILSQAVTLTQFWLASACLSLAIYPNGAVLSALATDLLRPANLNKGLSLMSMTGSVAAIIGLAVTGYLFHWLGVGNTFGLAAVLAAVATGLLTLLPKARPVIEGIFTS
jgi:MFS transporter, DHA1 family, tetracycline resistance protein